MGSQHARARREHASGSGPHFTGAEAASASEPGQDELEGKRSHRPGQARSGLSPPSAPAPGRSPVSRPPSGCSRPGLVIRLGIPAPRGTCRGSRKRREVPGFDLQTSPRDCPGCLTPLTSPLPCPHHRAPGAALHAGQGLLGSQCKGTQGNTAPAQDSSQGPKLSSQTTNCAQSHPPCPSREPGWPTALSYKILTSLLHRSVVSFVLLLS